MALRFYVIGDEETVLGFRLVGVEGRVVETPEETRQVLQEVLKMEGIGIVILTERIAASLREEIDRHIFKTSFPLLIEIPDRQGPLEGRLSIREMVRSAVGVHL